MVFIFFAEPAAHLDAGIALGTWDDVERRIGFLPQLEPAGAVKPGVVALGVETERHR
jgi:hypothetical protein